MLIIAHAVIHILCAPTSEVIKYFETITNLLLNSKYDKRIS